MKAHCTAGSCDLHEGHDGPHYQTSQPIPPDLGETMDALHEAGLTSATATPQGVTLSHDHARRCASLMRLLQRLRQQDLAPDLEPTPVYPCHVCGAPRNAAGECARCRIERSDIDT